jgi:hypothetical protein
MGIAWKVLLPLSLLNIVITAFIRLYANDEIPSSWWRAIIAILAVLLVGMFLQGWLASRNEQRPAAG